MVCDMPSNNLAGSHINHSYEIPEPIQKPEVGEITSLDDIRMKGAQNLEDVCDRCLWPSKIIKLHVMEASAELRLESIFPHHTDDGLSVHLKLD